MDHVIAVGDIFGMVGARTELRALLTSLEGVAAAAPGCHRYTFAVTLDDPDHVVFVSEWESLDALQRFHSSETFLTFQLDLHDLIVRTSELSVNAVSGSLRPVSALPMDPRDATSTRGRKFCVEFGARRVVI